MDIATGRILATGHSLPPVLRWVQRQRTQQRINKHQGVNREVDEVTAGGMLWLLLIGASAVGMMLLVNKKKLCQ